MIDTRIVGCGYSGTIARIPMAVTRKDVARESGVNTSTVSRALTREPGHRSSVSCKTGALFEFYLRSHSFNSNERRASAIPGRRDCARAYLSPQGNQGSTAPG